MLAFSTDNEVVKTYGVGRSRGRCVILRAESRIVDCMPMETMTVLKKR